MESKLEKESETYYLDKIYNKNWILPSVFLNWVEYANNNKHQCIATTYDRYVHLVKCFAPDKDDEGNELNFTWAHLPRQKYPDVENDEEKLGGFAMMELTVADLVAYFQKNDIWFTNRHNTKGVCTECKELFIGWLNFVFEEASKERERERKLKGSKPLIYSTLEEDKPKTKEPLVTPVEKEEELPRPPVVYSNAPQWKCKKNKEDYSWMFKSTKSTNSTKSARKSAKKRRH